MNLEINQDNVRLLLPGKLSWMAQMYTSDHGGSVVDAIKAIYRSPVYKQLETESTKYWHYGPVALYEQMAFKG